MEPKEIVLLKKGDSEKHDDPKKPKFGIDSNSSDDFGFKQMKSKTSDMILSKTQSSETGKEKNLQNIDDPKNSLPRIDETLKEVEQSTSNLNIFGQDSQEVAKSPVVIRPLQYSDTRSDVDYDLQSSFRGSQLKEP